MNEWNICDGQIQIFKHFEQQFKAKHAQIFNRTHEFRWRAKQKKMTKNFSKMK